MQTRSSTKRIKPFPKLNNGVEDQKKLVLPELGPVVELVDQSFARSLYQDLASDSAIDNFLKSSRFYSLPERRWGLPQDYSKLLDTNHQTPMCNLISGIIRKLWGDAFRHGTRKVVDTHSTELRHSLEDPPTHSSRPSLVIKATGPSFQLPRIKNGKPRTKTGFSNIATCIELQVEGEERPVSEQLAQAAIYARQLFMQQPNRRGAQYTPPLDFDDDPHTFVRIVLGLSSPNEEDIGLDTSIHWRIEDGRKSAKQLLGALRDAIAGHRNLHKRGTLHRDVSPQNVLLGKPGAEPGERGILIDFDMATRCDETGFHPPIDWRIGIPLFQSTQLLYSVDFEDPQKAFAHDHVDDLESFFYILTYIVYTYDSRGNTYPRHELFKEWKSYAGHNAADAKGVYLVSETDVDPIIAPRWPNALLDVFCGFRTFLADLFEDRQHARRMEPEEVLELLEEMASKVDQHYDEVLQMFDTGIQALDNAENESATAKAPLTDLDSVSVQSSSHLKRPREEDPDTHLPTAKRSNFSA
ncbi:hypothetical protein MD484_g5420, partial [Candolleomyces efflorescens]